jgi:hypothetical protein
MKRRTDESFEPAIRGRVEVQRFKRIFEAPEDAFTRIGQRAVKIEKYVHDNSLKIIDHLRKILLPDSAALHPGYIT